MLATTCPPQPALMTLSAPVVAAMIQTDILRLRVMLMTNSYREPASKCRQRTTAGESIESTLAAAACGWRVCNDSEVRYCCERKLVDLLGAISFGPQLLSLRRSNN